MARILPLSMTGVLLVKQSDDSLQTPNCNPFQILCQRICMLTRNERNIGIFILNFICILENGIDVDNLQGFYGRVKGHNIVFQPTNILWLIRCDFLIGETVHKMVNEALHQVPNLIGNKILSPLRLCSSGQSKAGVDS